MPKFLIALLAALALALGTMPIASLALDIYEYKASHNPDGSQELAVNPSGMTGAFFKL